MINLDIDTIEPLLSASASKFSTRAYNYDEKSTEKLIYNCMKSDLLYPDGDSIPQLFKYIGKTTRFLKKLKGKYNFAKQDINQFKISA